MGTPTNADDLTLYHYEACPFCYRVQRALDHLGVQIRDRNILEDPEARNELIAATGRRTVPVLRIDTGDGPEWMPESADIVRYLQKRFG